MTNQERPTELEKARKVVQDVIDERIRWGRHAGFASYTQAAVLDALVAVGQSGVMDGENAHDLKEQLTLSNRQLGAAKSREIKLRADVDRLTEENRNLNDALFHKNIK